MQPQRIQVSRIIDFGDVVSLVGTDVDDGHPVVVHIDRRPAPGLWEAWLAAGFEPPIEYEAEWVTLAIDFDVCEASGGAWPEMGQVTPPAVLPVGAGGVGERTARAASPDGASHVIAE